MSDSVPDAGVEKAAVVADAILASGNGIRTNAPLPPARCAFLRRLSPFRRSGAVEVADGIGPDRRIRRYSGAEQALRRVVLSATAS